MRLRLALACAAVAGLAAAQHSVNRTLASNVLWANGYSFGRMGAQPHAGVETSDGGFLMVGDGRDRNNKTVLRHILILKTNSRGGLEWQLKLGDCGWNYGKFGIELNDKTFLVAGAFCGPRKTSDGNSLKRTLFRIGWKGELLNTQSFDNPIEQHGKRDIFMCVSHTQGEGNYVILTGTVGGENMTENVNRQYQDEPMFLLYGVRFAAAHPPPSPPSSSTLPTLRVPLSRCCRLLSLATPGVWSEA